MIIVVEGVSAAGKTTWASRYTPAVIDEVCATPQSVSLAEVGRFWGDINVDRLQRGLDLESRHGVVCMDTDPLKIHYSWCLWQVGQFEVAPAQIRT